VEFTEIVFQISGSTLKRPFSSTKRPFSPARREMAEKAGAECGMFDDGVAMRANALVTEPVRYCVSVDISNARYS